jgi:hypothetical protein
MIQNLEIRQEGERYVVLEQAGSNYHAEEPVHEAAGRDETEQWLLAQGAAQADVTRAFEDIVSTGRVYVEIEKDYSEAEGFPRE